MVSSQAVADVLAAYWFEVDHRAGAGAHLFFTPDGELSFDAARFQGRAAIQGVYLARSARGPRVSRHVMSNVHVLRTEGDRVEVMSTLCLYAQDGTAPRSRVTPVAIADVHDRLLSTPDGLLFTNRVITNQFLGAGTEFAVPTESQTPVTHANER